MNLQQVLEEHSKWLNGKGGKRANLCSIDLQYTNLRGVDLSDANLIDADLRYVDLQYANLRKTNLRGIALYGANLRHANLHGANLIDANLSGADLIGADLRGADLHCANLRNADLRDANLRHAGLRYANLHGANLWGTIGSMREIKSLQLAVYPIAYTATHLQIGCENHLIQKWWEFTEDEIYDMDGQRALAFWRKYKDHIRSTIELAPAVKS